MESERIVQKIINDNIIYYDKKYDIIYDNANKREMLNNGYEYQRILTEDIYDTIYEVTLKCNQLCENCFSKSNSASKEEMDFDFIYNDILKKAERRIRVAITGGEPFFHSEIDKILNLPTIFRDIQFVINTNGNYYLQDNLYELIINNHWLITFSIHGGKDTHNHYTNSDGYESVICNIQKLQGKASIQIYSVINQYMTRKDIDDVINVKDAYNIDYLRFITPRNFGRVNLKYDKELEEYLHSICMQRDDIGIKSKGSLSELINVNKVSRMAR